MSRSAHWHRALCSLMHERQSRHIVLWCTLLYVVLYLWAIGDIHFHSWLPEFSIIWTEDPLGLLFKQRNLFYFEGIAIINLPVATYLFSPVNLIIGLLLAVLVGLNLAISWRRLKQARRYDGQSSATLLVTVPALLAGTTCSAPVILVLLGVQASAAMLAFFSMLVPIALVLLIGALLFNLKGMSKAGSG